MQFAEALEVQVKDDDALVIVVSRAPGIAKPDGELGSCCPGITTAYAGE
ncbi:hypothetical protein [Sulfuritalea sp.]|nr:hypothetical protein [Sulfuritalea sp.]MBN8476766.1 hypothetical protein [Sulfuritalea sp.]